MISPRGYLRVETVWIMMLDLVSLISAMVISVHIHWEYALFWEYFNDNILGFLFFAGCIIFSNYLVGNYSLQGPFSRFNFIVNWFFSITIAVFFLSVTSYAMFELLLGRGVLALTLAVYGLLSLLLKLIHYRYLFKSGIFANKVAIIGDESSVTTYRSIIENQFILPAHQVVSFIRMLDIENEHAGRSRSIGGVGVIDVTHETFEEVLTHLGINILILADDSILHDRRLYGALRRLRFGGIEIMTPQSIAEYYQGRVVLDSVDEDWMLEASFSSRMPVIRRVKRLSDILLSLMALIPGVVLMILVYIALKVSAPGYSAFYSQVRSGLFEKPFTIFKFRTMRPDAEIDTGPVWASDDDPRITRLGKILRRSRLDELPQLVNILIGDMSFVGPRPERPEFVRSLEDEIPFYSERSNIMPGLTGWAQINYPYGDSVEDARKKLEYDFFYLKNMSLSLDLQIMLQTLRIILFGKERHI
jgi:exopolysaccharide biosynthesis polyprenyl glycosylphosphotransferase